MESIEFVEIDPQMVSISGQEWSKKSCWGERVLHFLRLDDGLNTLAKLNGEPAGLISVYWRELPQPLTGCREIYIDMIEVFSDYKRKGIATQMIQKIIYWARQHGAYQVRAWSSQDKVEAIPMWKALGFGMCPATTYPGGQEIMGYFVTKVM